MIEGILIGLTTALTLQNILMVMVGCFFGTIIGMLPGLGPMTAIALMIPITYGFDPATGLILMAGVYYGAVFGGSTSSILLNAPGVPGTVATSFDGYPMAQQGKAGKALAIAAWSSFAGGTLSAIYLLFMAPSLSKVSLSFRSPDYFALMILGLTAIAAFSSKGQFLKAMMMVVLGLMLASVGQDSLSDITRFTFNNMNLTDGISFVLVVMATFAMSEALTIIIKGNDPSKAAKQISLTDLGSIKVNKEETKQMAVTIPRSSILGFIVGVLPGAGATIASFLAYGMERNFVNDKEKEKFGVIIDKNDQNKDDQSSVAPTPDIKKEVTPSNEETSTTSENIQPEGEKINENISKKQWIGVLLGFSGAALVLGLDVGSSIPIMGLVATIIALIAITSSTIWQKKLSNNLPLSVSNMYQALGGVTFHIIIIIFFAKPYINFTQTFLIAMSHQVFLVSFGAFTILMYLIKNGTASKTSSLFFLVPPTTAVMAWFVLGEKLLLIDIIGLLICTFGVYIATRTNVSKNVHNS